MDGQALMQQLQAAVGTDAAAIAQATKALQAVGGSPGVSAALAHIGLQPQLDFGVRQLALLVSGYSVPIMYVESSPAHAPNVTTYNV